MTPESLTLQIEDLLAQRRWLVELSRHLVKDAAEAEDVAQETMIRALRHSGSAAPERLRGWLAATARNVVFERHRGAGRRLAREQAVATPESAGSPAPEEALAQAEFRARLARYVVELGEDERTAVALKYYEGLETAAIAERTGAQAHTVRQRISRGVAKLRERLNQDDEQHGGPRWVAIAAGIAKGGGTAGTKISAGALGTWSSLLWLAGAVALLGVLGFWWINSHGGDQPIELGAQPSITGPEASELPVDPQVAAVDAPGERSSITPDSESARSLARILVVDSRTGRPAEGVSWIISPTGRDDMGGVVIIGSGLDDPWPLAAGVTGADGVASFWSPGDGLVQLITLRSGRHARGSFAIDLAGAHVSPRTIELHSGTTVTGRAIDDIGQPVRGAWIGIEGRNKKFLPVGRTDANGRFEVPCVANFPRAFRRPDTESNSEPNSGSIAPGRVDPSNLVVAWRRDWTPTVEGTPCPVGERFTVELPASNAGTEARTEAGTHDVGDVVLRRPRRYIGRVIDAENRPVAGALVQTHYRTRSARRYPLPVVPPEGSKLRPGRALTGADGTFELSVSGPQRPGQRISATSPYNSRSNRELPRIARGETYGPFDLRLPDSDSLELRLRDNYAAEGDLSWFRSLSTSRIKLVLHRPAGSNRPDPRPTSLHLTASGSVHLSRSMLPPLPVAATLHATGYEPLELQIEEVSGVRECRLERLGAIRVTIKVEGEKPAPWVRVQLSALPPKVAPVMESSPTASFDHDDSTVTFSKRVPFGDSTLVFPDPGGGELWVYAQMIRPDADEYEHEYTPVEVRGPFKRDPGALVVNLPAPTRPLVDRYPSSLGAARATTPVTARIVSQATGRPIEGAALRCTTDGIQNAAQSGADGSLTLRVPAIEASFTVEAEGHQTMRFGPIPLREGVTLDLGVTSLAPMETVEAPR